MNLLRTLHKKNNTWIETVRSLTQRLINTFIASFFSFGHFKLINVRKSQ